LSIEITDVVRRHKECFDEETREFMERDPEPFLYPSLHFVKDSKESRAINDYKGPCIVIASSGMLEAGRIRHHIAHHIEDARNTILLTSYTPPDSLGSMLKRGDKKVKIWDRIFNVRADIVYLEGMSAHADQAEMLKFLSCQDKSKIDKIFLVHGDYPVQLEYKEKLQSEGYRDITIPAFAEVHEI
jgi:metallo-beta-lactamase family protein